MLDPARAQDRFQADRFRQLWTDVRARKFKIAVAADDRQTFVGLPNDVGGGVGEIAQALQFAPEPNVLQPQLVIFRMHPDRGAMRCVGHEPGKPAAHARDPPRYRRGDVPDFENDDPLQPTLFLKVRREMTSRELFSRAFF